MVSFTVVTPTIGRLSLEKTARSIFRQRILLGDEWIIVEDGREQKAFNVMQQFYPNAPLPIRYFTTDPTHNCGNEQRNLAMSEARGTHLLFMDDDDIFTEGAWEAIRKECEATPAVPLLFRMSSADNPPGLIWNSPAIGSGNVGTPNLVLPNHSYRSKWGFGGNVSDYEFIKAVCKEVDAVRFVDCRTCIVKGDL